MRAKSSPPVSIVIPTYQREQVMIDSVAALLELEHPAAEILLVDQTEQHERRVEQILEYWNTEGRVRWIRQNTPSITRAMNHGLQLAKCPLVLFLDDDIEPNQNLVQAHSEVMSGSKKLWATVGQVLQPGEEACPEPAPRQLKGLRTDFDFPFHSTIDALVENVMAGNLCVNRDRAISIGGFDERFVGAAFRFESDFARRLVAAGGTIRFVGQASIRHLRAGSGGTRALGSHMISSSPLHGMGDYYYALKHGSQLQSAAYGIRRMLREVSTRFHLTHPWYIPAKLLGELRAWRLAIEYYRKGPSLLTGAESA